MRDGGGVEDPRRLQLQLPAAEVVEEPNAVTKNQRCHVDLQLVEQAGLEILLGELRSSCDQDVSVTGGRSGLLERGFDAVGDEGECGSSCMTSGSRAWWLRTKTGTS